MPPTCPPALPLAYCANVHPGRTHDEALAAVAAHAPRVRTDLGWADLGVGLWFSANALAQAQTSDACSAWRALLQRHHLSAHTFNGFPHGDFHATTVKHAVYRPTWAEAARLDYTLGLAELQAKLLPPGSTGSISTLPLGWDAAQLENTDFLAACAHQFRLLARQLARLETQTSRRIRVAIEPEPGCTLDSAADLARFWEVLKPDDVIQRHLGVCHDICHSAVMFEPQQAALATYAAAGIPLVKIQISNALAAENRHAHALAAFSEPRYLHQTVVRHYSGCRFFEDLPLALSAKIDGEWRVHFHVPLFAETLGELGTTQTEVRACLAALPTMDPPHLEVETYAWSVLPAHLQPTRLTDGLTAELRWTQAVLDKKPL